MVSLLGLPYYLMPLSGRVRSALHPWFKPSGIIGQSAGVASLVLLVFMWLYPLRKKFRALSFTGSVGRWLDVHILMGLALPWVAAIHATWRFDGLIGLGYAAMLLVCLSGVVGKYLYARIPRSREGLELSLEGVHARRQDLVERIAGALALDPGEVSRVLATAVPDAGRPGMGGILQALASADLARWRAGRILGRRWGRLPSGRAPLGKTTLTEVVRLARQQIALTQQLRMLGATQQVFRYWHVAHRPVAVTAMLAVLIHVAVAVAMGVTWFW
jgi:hypothetical protein